MEEVKSLGVVRESGTNRAPRKNKEEGIDDIEEDNKRRRNRIANIKHFAILAMIGHVRFVGKWVP